MGHLWTSLVLYVFKFAFHSLVLFRDARVNFLYLSEFGVDSLIPNRDVRVNFLYLLQSGFCSHIRNNCEVTFYTSQNWAFVCLRVYLHSLILNRDVS